MTRKNLFFLMLASTRLQAFDLERDFTAQAVEAYLFSDHPIEEMIEGCASRAWQSLRLDPIDACYEGTLLACEPFIESIGGESESLSEAALSLLRMPARAIRWVYLPERPNVRSNLVRGCILLSCRALEFYSLIPSTMAYFCSKSSTLFFVLALLNDAMRR